MKKIRNVSKISKPFGNIVRKAIYQNNEKYYIHYPTRNDYREVTLIKIGDNEYWHLA